MSHPSKNIPQSQPTTRGEEQIPQARLLLELAARVHRLEDEVEHLLVRTVELETRNEPDELPHGPGTIATPQPMGEPTPPTANAPVEIVRNGLAVTPEADRYLHERLDQLSRFYPRIMSKKVVLEGPVGHHQSGGPFAIDLYVDVPGRVVTVTRQRSDDLHVAIRETFDAAQRQLEDHARKQRGKVSPTIAPPRGRIVRIFPEAGYGFLTARDGHEVYFHRNSVLGDRFDDLRVGDEVRFAEEAGERGMQASTVAEPGD